MKEIGNLAVAAAVVIVAVAMFTSGGTTVGDITVLGDEGLKTITTSGTVEEKVTPDEAMVSFSIDSEAASAEQSQDQNRQTSKLVMSALSSLGINDNEIKTTQLSVFPIRDYNPETRQYEDRGFRTTHTILITTGKTDLVGKIVDDVVDAGANRVNSISFGLQDQTEKDIRKQMLDDAARESKEKAEAIASGLGSSITGIRSASESSFFVTPFFDRGMVAEQAFDSGIAGPTPVAQGEVTVTATVSTTFDIE